MDIMNTIGWSRKEIEKARRAFVLAAQWYVRDNVNDSQAWIDARHHIPVPTNTVIREAIAVNKSNVKISYRCLNDMIEYCVENCHSWHPMVMAYWPSLTASELRAIATVKEAPTMEAPIYDFES